MTYLTHVPVKTLIHLHRGRGYRDTATTRHQAVMSLFPQLLGDEPRAATGALFRFERAGGTVSVLVRSRVAPANLPGVTTKVEPPLPLDPGSTVLFRTVVNPTVRLSRSRVERNLTNPDDQEAWLLTRLASALVDIEIVDIDHETLRRSTSGHQVVNLVRFDGVAKVGDADVLERLLREGVGRAKAYGAGLLTVKGVR